MSDVPAYLKERARELRNNPTDAEIRLWSVLRTYRPRFTRQFVVGASITDFVCRRARLVVELDGGQHCDEEQDERRTQALRGRGWRVIRFWNNDVLENLDGVTIAILKAVAERLPDGAGPEVREARVRREPRRLS